MQEPLKPPPSTLPGPAAPTGKWAQNMNDGSSIKSAMDDSAIQLSLADCMGK